MEAAQEGDDPGAPCHVPSQFKRPFDCLGPAVAEEEHVGVTGRYLTQLPGQPQQRLMGDHSDRCVDYPLHLLTGCRDDARVIVPHVAGTEAG